VFPKSAKTITRTSAIVEAVITVVEVKVTVFSVELGAPPSPVAKNNTTIKILCWFGEAMANDLLLAAEI